MSETEQPKAPATVTPIQKQNGAGKPPQPKTAGQRLDDLERALLSLFQNLDNLAKDSATLRDAVRLLGNKVDALAKANIRGESPTDEILSQIMIDNNVAELKGKVEDLIKAQVLVATDIIGDQSFIVGRELAHDSDKVVNPRLQFSLTALAKETGDKLKGHLVGDIVAVAENQPRFEVLEVYTIQTPPVTDTAVVPQAEAAPATQTTETTAKAAPTTTEAPKTETAPQV